MLHFPRFDYRKPADILLPDKKFFKEIFSNHENIKASIPCCSASEISDGSSTMKSSIELLRKRMECEISLNVKKISWAGGAA
jgi:hypothetical protein